MSMVDFVSLYGCAGKWGGGGGQVGGCQVFSTHAFHIHTHTIQIRVVALCISRSATNKKKISPKLAHFAIKNHTTPCYMLLENLSYENLCYRLRCPHHL